MDYPPSVGLFPSIRDVQDYLRRYVQVYGLDRFIMLNHEVLSVTKSGEEWKFLVNKCSNGIEII